MPDQRPNVMSSELPRLAVSPSEAAAASGLGRSTIYERLASGELRSVHVGRRRLILVQDLRDWLSGLAEAREARRASAAGPTAF